MGSRKKDKYPLIGERIRQARLEIGMLQRELAGETYSRSYISQIERSIVIPSLSSLFTIGHRLGKPAAWFLMAHDEKMGYRFLHKQEEVTLLDSARGLEKSTLGWVTSVLRRISRCSGAELTQLQEFTSAYLTLNTAQRRMLLHTLQEIMATGDGGRQFVSATVAHGPPQVEANH
ncbi:MAG TPA: helix-turn-helix transcriptional regulator [Firmicutes bacterium]|nr:helix-turn-helix transcriptional regulator [Bacillota bacterium]